MAPLVQLDLREVPVVPEALAGIALITVFLATNDDQWALPDGPNDEDWLLRAYSGVDGLVAIDAPALHSALRPRALIWERVDDYPGYEDLADLVDADVLERLLGEREPEEAIGATVDGTKIGGWPSLIQSEISWPGGEAATFALQVDSDGSVGLNLWDGGVLHVGRTVAGEWVAEVQLP
jgi:hypothetical protein